MFVTVHRVQGQNNSDWEMEGGVHDRKRTLPHQRKGIIPIEGTRLINLFKRGVKVLPVANSSCGRVLDLKTQKIHHVKIHHAQSKSEFGSRNADGRHPAVLLLLVTFVTIKVIRGEYSINLKTGIRAQV